MKKNISILVLAIISVISLTIVSLTSIKSMSSRASYWMNRTFAAEAVLEEMIDSNEDYFLDVVMEKDCYNTWYSLGGNQ